MSLSDTCKCPKCKGRKFIGMFRHSKYGRLKKLCPKCYGSGEIDWVSNIFGTNEKPWQIIGRTELYNKFYNYAFFYNKPFNPFIVRKYHQMIFDTDGGKKGYYDF